MLQLRAVAGSLSNILGGVLVGAVVSFITYLLTAEDEIDRLQKDIKATNEEAKETANVSVKNFERLAKAVVSASDGSVKQKEALAELKRSYSDIIPAQDLEIEKLKKMQGEYGALTEAIRQNAITKAHEQNIQNIISTYGEEIGGYTKKLEKGLIDHFDFTEKEAARFVSAMQSEIKEGGLLSGIDPRALHDTNRALSEMRKTISAFAEFADKYGFDLPETLLSKLTDWRPLAGKPYFQKLFDAIRDQDAELNKEIQALGTTAPEMGKFKKIFDAFSAELKKGPSTNIKKNTYEWDKQFAEFFVSTAEASIAKAADKIGVFSDIFSPDSIDFEALYAKINEVYAGDKSLNILKNFVRQVQKEYNNIIPSDNIVKIIADKFESISSSTGISMDILKRYLMKSGDNIKDYVKTISDELANAQLDLTKMQFMNKEQPGVISTEALQEQIALVNALTQAVEWLAVFQKNAETKQKKTQLALLKDELKTVKDVYKRYTELLKYMSSEKAADEIQKVYGGVTTIDFLNPEDFKKRLDKILSQIALFSGKFRTYTSTLSEKGTADIKQNIKAWEGFMDTAKELGEVFQSGPFKGQKAITVGYGFTQNVIPGLKVGQKMTKEEADKYLDDVVESIKKDVDKVISKHKGELGEINELVYAALFDLAYNAGPGSLDAFLSQTNGNVQKMMEEIVNFRILEGTKFEKGLRKRREFEAAILKSALDPEATAETVSTALQEAFKEVQDVDFSLLEESIKNELNRLSNEIKRSKEAKDFYENILGSTGDRELATSMTLSIYGDVGDEIREKVQAQLSHAFVIDLDILPKGKTVENLQETIRNLDWSELESYLPYVKKAYQSTAESLVKEGQKASAEQVKTWVKELAKAKTYAEKRIEIARKTAERIREINASSLPKAKKDELIAGYNRKEAEDAAKAQYEAFKNSPMYVELFSNLESASTAMLKNMKSQLEGLQESWKDLDPNQLKELQSRLQEVDKLLAQRNPIATLAQGFKELFKSGMNGGKVIDDNLVAATKRAAEADKALAEALKELKDAQEEYDEYIKKHGTGDETAQGLAANRDAMQEKVNLAKEESDAAQDNAKSAQQEEKRYKKILQSISDGAKGLADWGTQFGEIGDGAYKTAEALGASEETLEMMASLTTGIKQLSQGLSQVSTAAAQFASGDILGGIQNVVSSIGNIISGIGNIFTAGSVASANRKIKRQQKLIDDLTRSYSKLEGELSKVFGSDYILDYGKQISNLKSQVVAYLKQAQAERSKGKKSSSAKIKEYEQAAQEAADKITELEGKLAEFFTGTDLASAARDFAESWIAAYKEFGSVTDAMQEKFKDMIENMVSNSLAAEIMKTQLDPLFRKIQEYAETDQMLTASEIADIAQSAPEYIDRINLAMTTLMNELAAAGYNVRQNTSGLTGISRDIAGASEESILGLAAGVNTQNFYISRIDQNLAEILRLMGGDAKGQRASASDVMSPYQTEVLTSLSTLPQMRDEMVAIRSLLDKVIKPVGTTSNYRVII